MSQLGLVTNLTETSYRTMLVSGCLPDLQEILKVASYMRPVGLRSVLTGEYPPIEGLKLYNSSI